MFSVIFPGQGSQIVGMGKEFFEKFDLVKKLFKDADEVLEYSLSKTILEGPKEELDLTFNTQPAIFLVSYSIYKVVTEEFNIELNKAKYFAGHSLGEYSALSTAGYLNFSDTIKLLRLRGDATVEIIEEILKTNESNFFAQIANDNSEGQIVISGKNDDLIKCIEILKSKKIKNIKLPVSAPFHCSLMKKATEIMKKELDNIKFIDANKTLISNVTAEEISNKDTLKKLLIDQIENRVRWRESVINMINSGVSHFVEIGPGKVLSGLVKRINKDVNIDTINTESDIKELKI